MTATSKDAVLLSIRRRPRIQGMGDVAGKSRESLTLVKSIPFVLRDEFKQGGRCGKVETFHVTGKIPGGAESRDLQAGR
jgi:hypothetical protein